MAKLNRTLKLSKHDLDECQHMVSAFRQFNAMDKPQRDAFVKMLGGEEVTVSVKTTVSFEGILEQLADFGNENEPLIFEDIYMDVMTQDAEQEE